MDTTKRAMASPVTDLSTFIERHGSSLPVTVKVEEGFCGTNVEDTLEADQILVLYKVERQNMITAFDRFSQELCVPRNTTNKVLLLPFEHYREHSTIQELVTAHETPFFRVLEDIPSLQICSETTLELLRDRPIDNFLQCLLVDLYGARELQLPLHLAGRFLSLLDPREYYLEEILAQYQLPMNVRFVSQSRANDDGVCAPSLSSLGNVNLASETEVEMVFAASVDDQLSLNLFPRTLEISVSCGFKVTADTSKKIKACRQSLEKSAKPLKRLDTIASNSYYFTACPLRCLNFEALQPPSISIPKSTGVSDAELLSKAKQCETMVETYINREAVTKRDHALCLQSVSKSGFSFEVEPADCENCDVNDSFDNSDVPKEAEKGTDVEPPLPPKTYSVSSESTAADATTQPRRQSSFRPVPKPRPRTRVCPAKKGENITAMQAQSYTTKFAEDDDEEACPELPPKSFLKTTWLAGCNDRDFNVSSDEYLSPLTPGSSSEDDAEEIAPELPPRPPFLIASGVEEIKDNGVPRDGRPPPLPPRCPGPSDSGFAAYLVVDVADWRAVEENAFIPTKDDDLYSEARQDGPRNPDLSLMHSPDERNTNVTTESPDQERSERGVNGRPHVDMDRPEREGRNEIPNDVHNVRFGKNIYYEIPNVVMERPENIEVNVRPKPRDPEIFRQVDFIQRDETRAFNELASTRSRQGGRENGDDVARKFKEESSEDDCHYEEIETPLSLPTEHLGKENAVDQKKTKLQGLSKNLESKNTHSPTLSDTRPHHPANVSHQRSRSDMMISGRREEDWMDLRDIDQFFKLKKQIDDAKKQIIMTKQTIASESQKQQPSDPRTDSTSDHIANAHHMETNSVWDTNQNSLNSAITFCKPLLQTSTQAVVTSSEGVLSNRKVVDLEKKLEKKKPSLSSPEPENTGPGKATYDRDCTAFTNVEEVTKSDVTNSDDDDDYEECFDRKYANQQTGIGSSSYENLLESGNTDDGINSVHYLQLENPNEVEDDETVYVNFDAQESDKGLGKKKTTAQEETVILEESCIEEPPPLPPKKQASSIRDSE